jgi:hypothetical protein
MALRSRYVDENGYEHAEASILLTEAEMQTLDDGQGWYKPGDEVWLGGRIGGPNDCDLDLCVNGKTHDNWITLNNLPPMISARLSDEAYLSSPEPREPSAS